MPAITEAGRAAIVKCRAIVGGEFDAFAPTWRDMAIREREFWLDASRLPKRWAQRDKWQDIPGDVRCTLKNNLYRAAKRAESLIGAAA